MQEEVQYKVNLRTGSITKVYFQVSYMMLISPRKTLCLGPRPDHKSYHQKYGPEPVLTLRSNIWSRVIWPMKKWEEDSVSFPRIQSQPKATLRRTKSSSWGAPCTSSCSTPHHYTLALPLASFRKHFRYKTIYVSPQCSLNSQIKTNNFLRKAWSHPEAWGGKLSV